MSFLYMETQAIIFDGRKGWNQYNALQWILAHNMAPIKPYRLEGNMVRFRMRAPKEGAVYATKILKRVDGSDTGIRLVLQK
jgi:hypothetical protein